MKSGQGVSRRWVLAGLLAGAATPVWAEAPKTSPLPRRRGETEPRVAIDANKLIDAAKLGGAVGYVVADAKTGQVLEEVSGDLAQPPASVAKVMTTLFALEHLGAAIAL